MLQISTRRAVQAPLFIRQANGRYREADRDQITEAAALLIERDLMKRDVLTSPQACRDALNLRLRNREHEVFAAMFLDNRHRLIEYRELFRGTIDGASVHPREVVRDAIELNAAAVVLAHNHPSGVSEPSQADLRITERLRDALALVDVRVLDHLIVGEGPATSFAERGLL